MEADARDMTNESTDIRALFLRKGKVRTEGISLIAERKKILSFESLVMSAERQ